MKAILVVDMPNNCSECPCFYDYLRCQAKDGLNVLGDEIPRGCPLKSMPEWLPTPYLMRQIMIANGIQTEKPPYTEEYQKGYNDCISEILGGE